MAVRVAATMTTSCITRSSQVTGAAGRERSLWWHSGFVYGQRANRPASARTGRSVWRQVQAFARTVDGAAANRPAQHGGQAVYAGMDHLATRRADLLVEHLLRPIR